VRVGRRVLIPMKSVNDIASKGISKKQIRNQLASTGG
jgi:hypothetical protein